MYQPPIVASCEIDMPHSTNGRQNGIKKKTKITMFFHVIFFWFEWDFLQRLRLIFGIRENAIVDGCLFGGRSMRLRICVCVSVCVYRFVTIAAVVDCRLPHWMLPMRWLEIWKTPQSRNKRLAMPIKRGEKKNVNNSFSNSKWFPFPIDLELSWVLRRYGILPVCLFASKSASAQ